MRLDAAIAHAAKRLSDVSDSARLDAELLLCRTIDMPRSYVYSHPEDELDDLAQDRFETLLNRRSAGEPIAYITGKREFWSQNLHVSPATLVPRPETELLVELALHEIPKNARLRILDLGTGSGAIAIAIAVERPLCDVVATDISPGAIAVARENVREAGLANVRCIEGSWIAPVSEMTFDFVLSNPPYVRTDDQALVKLHHEPRSALASGADGLDDIRILAADCMPVVAPSGYLMIEHGAEQKTAVASLLDERGWNSVACHNDLSGLPRVTVARRDGK